MKKENEGISCPKCGNEVDINALLYKRLSDEVKNEYDSKFHLLAEKEAQINETISKRIQTSLQEEKKRIEDRLRKQIVEEKSDEIDVYRKELEQKTEEVKLLNKTRAELEAIKREKSEMQEKIMLEYEQKFSRQLNEERQKIKTDLENNIEFKIREKEHVIEQLKTKLAEASRKAEQGSVQIQGEVQEIAIEDYLKASFPLDEIQEIRKGVRGADCLQIINTPSRQKCGSIYFESKRAQWQNTWLDKFKDDMRETGATFGVLVTSSMPKNMDRFGQQQGIWICSYTEFQALCFVLRESAIMLDAAYTSQENKGDKMVMLYDFLTSSEFRLNIEAIVDGFVTMTSDLQKERRALELLFTKREKLIQKMLLNTQHVWGSIKGVAGNAVASIKALELPDSEETN